MGQNKQKECAPGETQERDIDTEIHSFLTFRGSIKTVSWKQ